MRFKTRYRFWHVVLTFIGLGIFAAIFYYFIYVPASPKPVVIPVPKLKPRPGGDFRAFVTLIYFITFFYFTLNYYYNLIAANKKFISFLKLTGAIILISFSYHTILYY